MGWPSSINVSSKTLPSSEPPSRNSYAQQRCLRGLPHVRKNGGHKTRYLDALILIASKWDMEFHVHIDTSNLTIGAMLALNPTRKCD